MSTQSRKRTITAIISGALLALLMPGIAAAAPAPTTFEIYLGSSCIGGYSAKNTNVTVAWRSAAGVLKVKETIRTGSGYWEVCASSPRVQAKAGDRIKATVGSTTRKLVIPKLTLKLDRVNDVYRGRAPAGSTITLNYLPSLFADFHAAKTVRVRADGTWQYKKAGLDIMGGMYADMRWKTPKNDLIIVDGVAPRLSVTLNKARFSGTAKPKITVKVKLKNATTGVTHAVGKAATGRFGGFSGVFRNASGKKVPLAAGDRLVALKVAADANWIVPNITGNANAATDIVSGRCFDAGTSYGWYDLEVVSATGSTRGWAAGTTAPNGSFTVDFSDPELNEGLFGKTADVKSGDTIRVGCLQDTGDWVQLNFLVP